MEKQGKIYVDDSEYLLAHQPPFVRKRKASGQVKSKILSSDQHRLRHLLTLQTPQ